MDSAKSAIKSFVLDLRKTLEVEIETGLRRYGLAAGKWRDVSELKHLDDRGIADRIRMEEAIRHEMRRAGEATDERARAEAVRWFVREVAFTHLNRLVALKVLEVRGLIPEIIQTRPEYGSRSRAHRDYREAHPTEAAAPDDALEAAIKSICRLVYPEFRIMFDVGDPAEGREAPANSLLWPSYPTLKACLAKINALDADAERPGPPTGRPAIPEESVWAEDEIIGWIYQFYNAKEKAAIHHRGKPKHPAEVAVINQYFTPRWIVKFLVDNTLGRLWLEMHPDSPRVRAKCDYLVPEPRPSPPTPFPEAEWGEADSPINNPAAPPRRPAKRPQDIRLIDPACGTMHFGHYAFEVFQSVYADAREQGWVTGDEALTDEEAPAAILRHNLYGVDIDLRAVQLAALSLFIKAKSANPQVRIDRVNLVVADAYLPEGKVREDFLKQYAGEPVIQRAFREVFESLNNVAEVGSLLRVEARFQQILEAANHPAANGKKNGQNGSNDKPHQPGFADIAPGWGVDYTIEQMLEHLRQFTRHALQEHDLNAQLFAAETEKSVALLDVFMHKYDVVVMNPPFGSPLDEAKNKLNSIYKAFSSNLLCVFVEKALFDLAPEGLIGAVLDRTFLLKISYEGFRRKVLLDNGSVVAFTDLGWNILDDANVEVSTLVISANHTQSEAVFLRAPVGVDLATFSNPTKEMQSFMVPTSDFISYPNASFAYWTPSSIRRAFREFTPLDPNWGMAKEGLHPNDASRFLRVFWEVASTNVGMNKKWVHVTNGGGYAPFYRDNDMVVFYEDQAAAIKSLRGMRNEHLQFKEGITWGKRTDLISFQYLSDGHAFTHEGLCFFPKDLANLWVMLSLLNSSVIRYTANTLCGQHKLSGYIGQLPYCRQDSESWKQLNAVGKRAYDLKAEWDTGNETCTRFSLPWFLLIFNGKLTRLDNTPVGSPSSLSVLVDFALDIEAERDGELQQLQAVIDERAYELYEISPEDRALIERELGERPKEIVWPYAEKLTRKQKVAEHVARLMSYCLLEAIKADPDGLLPISEGAGHLTALLAVRAGLEKYFGEAAAYQIETDSAEYLGRPLADWLAKNFWKDYHLKWYKNRPILWQLQSAKGQFACLVHIHKLSRDTLLRVRTQYLWPARNAFQTELEAARAAESGGNRSAARRVEKLETALDELAAFEKALVDVIEARVKCDIPHWAEGPYRDGAYDPVLDDGVAVNLLPLQTAGLLAKNKVV